MALILCWLLTASLAADPAASLRELRYAAEPDGAVVAELLEAALGELDGRTRGERCSDEFVAGELYRHAAAAAPGAGYEAEALSRFRQMRVEYLDLVAGQLGFIGEARVHRDAGRAEEAHAALGRLLDVEGTDRRVTALARLEEAELVLIEDPDRAIRLARRLGDKGHWLLARAYAAKGDRDRALEHAGSEGVVRSAPVYARLSLLAGLGRLDPRQRHRYVEQLATLGRRDEALAVLDEHATVESAGLYGRLLREAGRAEEAVEQVCAAAEASEDPGLLLACGEALAAAGRGDEAGQINRRVLAGSAPDEMRAGALRWLTRTLGPRLSAELLESYPDLVESDPDLRYARAVARSDTDELEAIALETERRDLRAAAWLLRCQIEPDPGDALAILERHWELLSAEPLTAAEAPRLRARLKMELGMTDAVVAGMIADPADYEATALLTAAEALAERFEDGIAGQTRHQVLRLAAAAIGRAPGDDAVAIEAARATLRVEAYADTERVLRSVSDPGAETVRAAALLGLGRPQEALDSLERANAADATLLRGRILLDMGRANEALTAIRASRRRSDAGSDEWWMATFALGRAQLSLDHREAAARILRVAALLHPIGGRPALRRNFDTLIREANE